MKKCMTKAGHCLVLDNDNPKVNLEVLVSELVSDAVRLRKQIDKIAAKSRELTRLLTLALPT